MERLSEKQWAEPRGGAVATARKRPRVHHAAAIAVHDLGGRRAR
jgi:hypothetical protein